MNTIPSLNLQNKIEKQVKMVDTALVHGSGDLEVFATPAMVALMEQTAQESLKFYLAENETTVGVFIEVTHQRASLVGTWVHCVSTLVASDGKKFEFEIIVSDEKGVIGEAKHTRYLVDRERFMSKLK